MDLNPYYLRIPRSPNLRENVFRNFHKYCSNSELNGIQLSSYWNLYLPKILIELMPNNGKPKKIRISHSGFAELIPLSILSVILRILSILRNIFLLIKYQCRFTVIIYTLLILTRTNRLLVFDSVKHAILISKVEKILRLSDYNRVVIIGDGFGFLGTLLKSLYPNLKVTFVNLSKNLFLDYCFYTSYFRKIDEDLRLIEASSFTNFHEEEILFFNVASLAEMTHTQVSLYFDAIDKNSGILVSLNRNEKNHPDGTVLALSELLKIRDPKIIFEENPCLFYESYPTSLIRPAYKPFDGFFHLKIIKF
jgi:hypothetical protein